MGLFLIRVCEILIIAHMLLLVQMIAFPTWVLSFLLGPTLTRSLPHPHRVEEGDWVKLSQERKVRAYESAIQWHPLTPIFRYRFQVVCSSPKEPAGPRLH